MNIKRFLPNVILLLVLLHLQQGSLVHAVEHPFHGDHDNIACDVFFAGEKLADVSLQSSHAPLLNISTPPFYTTLSQTIFDGEKPIPQSRSPPTAFS